MARFPLEPTPRGLSLALVRGAVNSTPAIFAVDTGAAAPFTALLSPEIAQAAGVEITALAPEATAQAIGPGPVSFAPARLDELRVGGVVLHDASAGVSPAIRAAARGLPLHFDAIVGHRFLEARTMAIDFAGGEIDFDAPDGAAPQAMDFSLAPGRPLTLVEARINGRGPFTLALDTGASAIVLSPATAAAAGVVASGAVQARGAGGSVQGGARMGRAEISLGPSHRLDQPLAVADILGPVEAAARARIDGVLGCSSFRSGTLTLCYRTRRFWVEAGSP